MKNSLTERFIAERGMEIDVDGARVVMMYRHPVRADQEIHVRFISHAPEPVQGLRIKLEHGTLRINQHEMSEAVIWLDSAPTDFSVLCHPDAPTNELRVWNCWRDAHGGTQSWAGNAGIVASVVNGETILKCSSGTGEFDPLQLVIGLRFGN